MSVTRIDMNLRSWRIREGSFGHDWQYTVLLMLGSVRRSMRSGRGLPFRRFNRRARHAAAKTKDPMPARPTPQLSRPQTPSTGQHSFAVQALPVFRPVTGAMARQRRASNASSVTESVPERDQVSCTANYVDGRPITLADVRRNSEACTTTSQK